MLKSASRIFAIAIILFAVPALAESEATLQRACDGGDAWRCSLLGDMYANGKGVAKDESRTVALYKKACDLVSDAGHLWICIKLGDMYANGRGVAKDESRTIALYKKACDGGDINQGCVGLAEMYANGRGVAKNNSRAAALYKKVVAFYTKACDSGKGLASALLCHNLANMYRSGTGVAKDEAHAAALYKKACDGGFGDDCGH